MTLVVYRSSTDAPVAVGLQMLLFTDPEKYRFIVKVFSFGV